VLRLATFNICSACNPQTGESDPALLATALRDLHADVLALQEVDRDQPRSGGQDQAALAAAAMGCASGNWRFAATLNGTPAGVWSPAPPDEGGTAYGIALLSRLPVREWAEIRLAPAPIRSPVPAGAPDGRKRILLLQDEPRVAIVAVLETATGPLSVVGTHLSFVPGWNVRQLRQLQRQLRPFPRPLVLAGDLNITGSMPALVTGWRPAARAQTFPAAHPRMQLDHILTDGLAASGGANPARAVQLPISDHRALAIELALERPAPGIGEQPGKLLAAAQRGPDEPIVSLADVEKTGGDLLRLDPGDVGPGRPVAGQLDG
jgi:endonuclease/exonuclease/phosphatase family metal-dependent hydrolase